MRDVITIEEAYHQAYFGVIALTLLGFSAIFLFLHLHRRSHFLKCFSMAWALEAMRVALLLARSRGVPLSDRWFAAQDVAYLAVSWLLVSGSAHFVGARLSRRWALFYFGLSAPLILANYLFLRQDFLHTPGWSLDQGVRDAVFYNMLVIFIPGGAARLLAMVWFFRDWRRTRLPGALLVSLFFLAHALGSLSVPLQWRFHWDSPNILLTWFLEILGLSMGVVVLSLNKQHAELVLAERKYELFFEKVVDAALLFNRQQVCTSANTVAKRRLGLPDPPHLLLQDLFEEQAAYRSFQEDILRSSSRRFEARLSTSQGQTFLASISGGIHYGLDGGLTGYFLTFDDITEQKRAEDERVLLVARERAARAEAEAANRMKDEFLATLSHELRTSLQSILGWVGLLRTGGLEEADSAYGLETIERNAKLQVQIIKDLLDISGIIAGRLHLDFREVAPAEVIEAAVGAMRSWSAEKGLQLKTCLDRAVGAVSGDPDRLQQVVLNLISNSVKFTPKGGEIEVSLEQDDSHAVIKVKDNGMGIRSDFLPRIFERFRQADSTSTRSHGGLGLGLAIVWHLVKLHGGTVRAESAGEGKGATFLVRLPLLSPAPALAGVEEEDTSFLSSRRLRGVRVLLVENDPDTCGLLETILQQNGAKVTVATSVPDALRVLEQVNPDVLLSDIAMPGEDGYSFIRKVRALEGTSRAKIPAVALTSYASLEDRERALLAGFQEHLAKPIEPSDLAQIVANLAAQSRGL